MPNARGSMLILAREAHQCMGRSVLEAASDMLARLHRRRAARAVEPRGGKDLSDLRQAFDNTLSDEFAEVMLGKLVSVLRPGPYDTLDEATLNAATALIRPLIHKRSLPAVVFTAGAKVRRLDMGLAAPAPVDPE